MVDKDTTFKEEWKDLMNTGREDVVKEKFINLLPPGIPGNDIYSEAAAIFEGEELSELCAELILTVFSDCRRDDFHNWNYEHLSFIIEASGKYDFSISEHLANGLPQQLFLRLKKKNLVKPVCD